ncbi:DUF6651 domain-containing protein [Duganella rivi]|uniref:DUF6651 domain-containing protein n=1 Tax=Duganella rivi TaxID=2666083 RepID=UPI001580E4E0|nr:DUF6651 domain-containing protein [Duganella rivi]
MKIKLDSNGNVILKNGHPLYKLDDGTEIAFDAGAAMTMVRNQAFAASKYVADNLNIPSEVAASAFGGGLRLEKGQLVAYGAGGVPMYSHRRPGELANLDEAIEQLVAAYPNRDMITKKAGAASPAGQPGAGRTATRQQFDAMSPQERAQHVRSGGTVIDGASKPAPAPTAQNAGAKVITRAQLEQMPHPDRAAYFKTGGTIKD